MVSLVGCLFGSCYVDRQVGRKVFFGWLVGRCWYIIKEVGR